MKEKNRGEWKKLIGLFTLGVALIAVYKLLDKLGDVTNWIQNLFSVLMPFIMALLLAYIFYLPCRKVESFYSKSKSKFVKKRARWFAIFTVYLIAIITIIVIIKFIVPTVYESSMELANNLPNYYNGVIEQVKELPESSIFKKIDLTGVIESLNKIKIEDYLNIEAMYLLGERSQIVGFARKLCGAIFDNNMYKTIGKYFRESNEIFFRFVSSQLLDAIIVGILTSIAMSLLGVRYAVLLGFMIGLFNLIPYLGAIIAIVLAVIITIFTGGITQAIWMLVIVTILQQIDANIINPKIIGNSLEISPILIIFSVTVVGAYFGIMGMFLAVPIVTVIKLIIEDFIRYREEELEE